MRLIRRVGALEAVAEERRTAPYRRLAAETGVPLDELLATADEARTFVECLRIRGLSLEEILARCAEHWGMPLDALRRSVEKHGVDLAPVERFT